MYLPHSLFKDVEDNFYSKNFDEIKLIGSGAFGLVYVAEENVKQRFRNKILAVKKIWKNSLKHSRDSDRVLCEFQAQDGLSHRNIVQLLDSFQDKHCVYFILEYCQGGDLHQHLQKCTVLSELDARIVLLQMTSAVLYLHDRLIIHRDIKPANVLLVNSKSLEHLKLCDFGLAKKLKSNHDVGSTMCGTPNYIAPEVTSKEYGTEVDVWSLGCLLYTMLLGSPPFGHAEVNDILSRIRGGDMRRELIRLDSLGQLSYAALGLLKGSLEYDWKYRYTAADVLRHQFLLDNRDVAVSTDSGCVLLSSASSLNRLHIGSAGSRSASSNHLRKPMSPRERFCAALPDQYCQPSRFKCHKNLLPSSCNLKPTENALNCCSKVACRPDDVNEMQTCTHSRVCDGCCTHCGQTYQCRHSRIDYEQRQCKRCDYSLPSGSNVHKSDKADASIRQVEHQLQDGCNQDNFRKFFDEDIAACIADQSKLDAVASEDVDVSDVDGRLRASTGKGVHQSVDKIVLSYAPAQMKCFFREDYFIVEFEAEDKRACRQNNGNSDTKFRVQRGKTLSSKERYLCKRLYELCKEYDAAHALIPSDVIISLPVYVHIKSTATSLCLTNENNFIIAKDASANISPTENDNNAATQVKTGLELSPSVENLKLSRLSPLSDKSNKENRNAIGKAFVCANTQMQQQLKSTQLPEVQENYHLQKMSPFSSQIQTREDLRLPKSVLYFNTFRCYCWKSKRKPGVFHVVFADVGDEIVHDGEARYMSYYPDRKCISGQNFHLDTFDSWPLRLKRKWEQLPNILQLLNQT